MERKLYSLEAINSNNKADRCVIKIKNDNGEYEQKSYLARIDEHITTYFKNKKQLLYYLKEKKIIAGYYDDIKITYRHNGINALELEFNTNEILKKIAKDSKTKIDIEKCEKQFNYVLNKFINLCKEDVFFDLINKSEQIPEHLKRSANQLNKLIEDNTNDSIKTKMEIKNTVRNMLMNYKNFRTILMYIDSYTNNKEIFKTTLLPNAKKRQKQLEIKEEIVDYDREEKEEFLTEEEIEYGYHGNKPTR